MASADPKELDYFRRGEVLRAFRGQSSRKEFDYFRRGEPTGSLDDITAPTPAPRMPKHIGQAVNRAASF